MSRRFHLAWFTNFTVGHWDGTFSHGGSPWDGKFYVDMAQALERACFDYVIYEDKLLVPEAYRGSTEARSGTARRDRCGRDIAHWGRAHHVDAGVATFHAGASLNDDRSYRRRSLRLEHRHQRRGFGSPEFRHGRAAAA
jgi:hypothetical protein